jgi:ribosomal protein L37E
MTLRLTTKRCRRCEGAVHIKDYKLYCNKCGFQPPYQRDGSLPDKPTEPPAENVSRETHG